MTLLIAVDPGVKYCGVAYFLDGVLSAAQLRDSSKPLRDGYVEVLVDRPHVVEAVVESQQVYLGTAKQAYAEDLINVAYAAGYMVSGLDVVARPLPREWAGQVPKEVRFKRMWSMLSAEETSLLERFDCPKALRHNVWDAVAIGLWQLKRRYLNGSGKK